MLTISTILSVVRLTGSKMKGYFLDEQSDIVKHNFAVIYAPRRKRTRFPENVVNLVKTEAESRSIADKTNEQYAATVIGPARSSEGFNIFYLVNWLDEN